MTRRIISTIARKGRWFPRTEPLPTSGLLWLPSELSWHLWVCHLSNALPWRCTEVRSTWSQIFSHLGPNQFYLPASVMFCSSCSSSWLSFFQWLWFSHFPPASLFHQLSYVFKFSYKNQGESAPSQFSIMKKSKL